MRPRTVFILVFKMTFLALKFALIQTRSSPLKFLCLVIENAPFFSFLLFLLFFNKKYKPLLDKPQTSGGPASGSLKITAFSYIQPSEPFLDLLTPASFTRKMRVLSQKRDACEILDLSAVT